MGGADDRAVANALRAAPSTGEGEADGITDPRSAYMNLRTCMCGEDAASHPSPGCDGFDPDWERVERWLFRLASTGASGGAGELEHIGWITRGDLDHVRSVPPTVPLVNVWGSRDPGDMPLYVRLAPPPEGVAEPDIEDDEAVDVCSAGVASGAGEDGFDAELVAMADKELRWEGSRGHLEAMFEAIAHHTRAGVPGREVEERVEKYTEAVMGHVARLAHPGAPEGERWWIIGQELMRGTGYHLTLTDKPWEGGEPVTLLRAPSPPDRETAP